VDYAAPRHIEEAGLRVVGSHELSEVTGRFDIILASAILEHITDAFTAIRDLTARADPRAYLYARTPFVLPLARLVPKLDMTYPAHVHDMGSTFWHRFIGTFGLDARLVSSRPSLVETTLRSNPVRTVLAHALKLPASMELALLGHDHVPAWKLVGGWEAVIRFG